MNAVVAGQDNTIAELKSQLSDAVALKNKLRDEADAQVTKEKETSCANAHKLNWVWAKKKHPLLSWP